MQATDGKSNYFPPKKPSAREYQRYLRAALKNSLAEVEHNDKPITQKQLERLRQLAFWVRNQAGFSPWVPVGFAFVAMLIIVAVFWQSSTTYIYTAPKDTWRIIERINEFDFVLQRVENGIPQVPWTFHFCHDLAPRFEIGETLVWFAYDDHGSCASIAPKDRGYVLDRGADHWPKLARNCRHIAAELPPACDGKPQFD